MLAGQGVKEKLCNLHYLGRAGNGKLFVMSGTNQLGDMNEGKIRAFRRFQEMFNGIDGFRKGMANPYSTAMYSGDFLQPG